ncbi:MAG: transposase [Desulfobacterales bacterium]|nr:transposase [Desulfobacterales bacterium]
MTDPANPANAHYCAGIPLEEARGSQVLRGEGLGFLRDSQHVICDGCFKYSSKRPFNFMQLYTLHGFVNGEAFPLLFALLPNKTADTYTHLFRVIRREVLNHWPDLGAIVGGTWNFDYEDAARNAFALVFPEALVRGCVFHYSQALIKRRGILGLSEAYANDNAVFRWFRRLTALCLMAPWLVHEVGERILGDKPRTGNPRWDLALSAFVVYYRDQWLRPLTRPDFIEQWNHWENDGPRTTNHAEGWHSSLRHKIPMEHPVLGVLIHHLKRIWHVESIRMRNMVRDPVRHPPTPRRPVDVRNDEQITRAKQGLDQYLVLCHQQGQLADPARLLQYLDDTEHRLGNRD